MIDVPDIRRDPDPVRRPDQIIRDNCLALIRCDNFWTSQSLAEALGPDWTPDKVRMTLARDNWTGVGMQIAQVLGLTAEQAADTGLIKRISWILTKPKLNQPLPRPQVMLKGRRYIRWPHSREIEELTEANTPWFLRSAP